MLKIKNTKLVKLLSLTVALSPLIQGCAAVVAGTAVTSIMVAQDRRSTGTIVDDKGIQLKATQIILDIAKEDPNVHVSAIAYNGRVLLIGQVPARGIRAEIATEIGHIDKVRQVHNEIILGAPTPMLTRSNDSWITTKIKSEMTVTKEFNPTRVKVITENGVVYLMGIVRKEEEEIAVDIARLTRGVKKVVKIFEYDQG